MIASLSFAETWGLLQGEWRLTKEEVEGRKEARCGCRDRIEERKGIVKSEGGIRTDVEDCSVSGNGLSEAVVRSAVEGDQGVELTRSGCCEGGSREQGHSGGEGGEMHGDWSGNWY